MTERSAVNTIVEWAIREFRLPGSRRAGNFEKSLQLSIRDYCEDNYTELSDADLSDIRDRFRRAITYPAPVTAADLCRVSVTDGDIDSTWYDTHEEFPKWDSVKHNWTAGNESARLPTEAIKNIHKYTTHILRHSYDPDGDQPYLWKGLIVGNVQSGKTATFTGLISKAIDVGYRIIVVLSGRLNSLRYQTQSRITSQIIGVSHDDSRSIGFDANIISLTKPLLNGDFGTVDCYTPSTTATILRASPHKCLVAVLKKHDTPLTRFHDWAEEVIAHHPDFRNFPLLIIDDEMDEASVNTGGDEAPDDDDDHTYSDAETYLTVATSTEDTFDHSPSVDTPSTTNQAITRLLKDQLFSRRMYLGFTATPYAIVAHQTRQQTSRAYQQYGPDIFPSDYLLVLEDSDNYCGGDLFVGHTEVVVRNMFLDQDRRLRSGPELLHLPEFHGIDGLVETIPAGECCQLCVDEVDANGDRTHGPSNKSRSHCRSGVPGKHHPIDTGASPCTCRCHLDDDVHTLVPVFEDVIPKDDDPAEFIYAQMVPSLNQAINDFILSGAARAQRHDGHEPCTMMINAHRRKFVHLDVKRLVLDRVQNIARVFSTGLESAFLSELRDRWESSFAHTISAFNGDGDNGPEDLVLRGAGKTTKEPDRTIATQSGSPDSRPPRGICFDEIVPHIPGFVEEIAKPENHLVLNSTSQDVVDYDRSPGLKAIIHGGNTLGRGLTFKGLLTAYVLRSHGDMSGLMQMQRWCGYRGEDGGERILDLMRIYLTQADRDLFHRMLAIEKKNRHLLSVYVNDNKTPSEYANILEQDPDTPLMSAAKSGALQHVGSILSGESRTQRTFRFNKNEDLDLDNNRSHLAAFLQTISSHKVDTRHRGIVYRDVSTDDIMPLLECWAMEDSPGFSMSDVQQWIRRLRDRNELDLDGDYQLTHWTVYIPSRDPSKEMAVRNGHAVGFDATRPIILGKSVEVYPYAYSLDRESSNRLKTITSPGFQEIDTELFFGGNARPSTHGLLLISPAIHPLNRVVPGGRCANGNPYPQETDSMHAAGKWPHLLALGLWFPTTTKLKTQLVRHANASNV